MEQFRKMLREYAKTISYLGFYNCVLALANNRMNTFPRWLEINERSHLGKCADEEREAILEYVEDLEKALAVQEQNSNDLMTIVAVDETRIMEYEERIDELRKKLEEFTQSEEE